jgi:predicted  nucleic acid-binding Zn-ribbon protein
MNDQIAQLMTEVDDLRNKVTDIHTCIMEIRKDMEKQKQYPPEHHKFVEEWVERSKRRRAVMDRISAQIGGWIVIALLGTIGTYVYNHTIGIVVTK